VTAVTFMRELGRSLYDKMIREFLILTALFPRMMSTPESLPVLAGAS
jgi:hypothetical protein